MRSIQVIVDAQGGIQIEALDFKGPDCEAATKFLEEALGEIKQRRRKAEYHARVQSVRRQQVGQ